MISLLPIGTRSIHRVRTAISNGAVQVWPTDLHMRRGIYMDGKHQSPATCDAVEALLRHELLAHIPEWLARKAGLYQLEYDFVHVLEGDFPERGCNQV